MVLLWLVWEAVSSSCFFLADRLGRKDLSLMKTFLIMPPIWSDTHCSSCWAFLAASCAM